MLARRISRWAAFATLAGALAPSPDAAAQPADPEQPAQRQKLEQVLQRYGTGEPRQIGGVLERKAGGRAVLETREDPSVQVEVANPQAVSRWFEAVPLELGVVRADDKLEIQSADLEVTSKWARSPYAGMEQLREVTEQHRAVEEAFDRAKRPGATSADRRKLRESLDDATAALGTAYAEVDSETVKEALRAQYRDLRRTGKAIYGSNRDDRYPPAAYQRIYENSRGGLALARRSSPEPHCSGFLIGDDLVLTNEHCVEADLPADLEARFNYEDDLQRRPLDEVRIPVKSFLIRGGAVGDMDFALLELGRTGDDRSAGDLFPPLCASTARVRRDDPVYVVGHPQGLPRTVHDNAFVYFPFQVIGAELRTLTLHVETEFENAEDAEERIAEFRESYRPATVSGTKVYQNYSRRWNEQPTIGIDADTFHANSGSPVLHRRNHLVVGILFDGEEDLTLPFEIGWRAHEAALPMSEVIAKLDHSLPEWRQRSGVCVDGT